MREIKFRIWDKSNKQFYIPNNFIKFWPVIELNGLIGMAGEFNEYQYGTKINQSNYIIQQYTGLKDKNGKEIYEGDIVKYKVERGSYNKGEFDEHISEVKFENGEFYPRNINNECDDSYYSFRLYDIEIVGNIFENPELLKRK